jgi:hypothetical protein
VDLGIESWSVLAANTGQCCWALAPSTSGERRDFVCEIHLEWIELRFVWQSSRLEAEFV